MIDGHSAVESGFALPLLRVTEANSALPNFSELRSADFFVRKFVAYAAYQIGVICIEQRTLSGCFGRGDLNHNNRSIIAESIQEDRIKDDIIICQRSLKQLYHDLFDEVLAEFNAKQARHDRKIANYQEHIRHSRQEKEHIGQLMLVHGIEWVKPGKHEKHKSVSRFKADKLREEIEQKHRSLEKNKEEKLVIIRSKEKIQVNGKNKPI